MVPSDPLHLVAFYFKYRNGSTFSGKKNSFSHCCECTVIYKPLRRGGQPGPDPAPPSGRAGPPWHCHCPQNVESWEHLGIHMLREAVTAGPFVFRYTQGLWCVKVSRMSSF